MLTKEQITFPMDYNALPRISGYAVETGEMKGQAYTALWSEDGENTRPDYFWPHDVSESDLSKFIEGL